MAKWSDTVPAVGGPIGRFVAMATEGADLVGTPYALVAIRWEPKAKYGARWLISAVRLSGDPELQAIGLKANPARDMQMEAAQAALREGTALDPVTFGHVRTASGNEAWVIDDYDLSADPDLTPGEIESRVAVALAAATFREDAGLAEGEEAPAPQAIPGERLAKAGKGK